MTYFPPVLYINPFSGTLSEQKVDNITDGLEIKKYQLSKIMGYKAYYVSGTTKLLVISKGSTFVSID